MSEAGYCDAKKKPQKQQSPDGWSVSWFIDYNGTRGHCQKLKMLMLRNASKVQVSYVVYWLQGVCGHSKTGIQMLEEEYQQELEILRSAQGRVPARQEDVCGQTAGYVTLVSCSMGALYISYLSFWFQPLSEVTFLGAEIFRHKLCILFAAIVTCGYKYLVVTRLTVNNALKLRVKNSLSEGKLWIIYAGSDLHLIWIGSEQLPEAGPMILAHQLASSPDPFG